MSCPEKDCFMCKLEAQYNKEHEIKEDYRPRPYYRDNIKTKIWFINIAIIIVFFLFMYSLAKRKK